MTDDFDETGTPNWTVEDAILMGNEGVAEALDDLENLWAEQYEKTDHELQALIRRGGHQIADVAHGGRQEIQITSYRNGPTYGWWSVSCSPEGHLVQIEQSLPWQYKEDGSFLLSNCHKRWTVPADTWRLHAVLVLEELLGKRIVREAAPLLKLPVTIAPDGWGSV